MVAFALALVLVNLPVVRTEALLLAIIIDVLGGAGLDLFLFCFFLELRAGLLRRTQLIWQIQRERRRWSRDSARVLGRHDLP